MLEIKPMTAAAFIRVLSAFCWSHTLINVTPMQIVSELIQLKWFMSTP